MRIESPAYRCYRSVDHPDGRPRSWEYASALVRPIGICMLPVMIGALVAMLEGLPALRYLTIGSPIAIGVASVWTWIRVRDDVVEVCISTEKQGVSVLSRHDAASPRRPEAWTRLFNVETSDDGRVFLTAGHEEFRLEAHRFPDMDELLDDCLSVLYPPR
ncbi:MAG: hypothetical protein HKN17_01590 [Rhodothermales bacterium]|nr:hypothetical protein [Rhodothermales bacterium]